MPTSSAVAETRVGCCGWAEGKAKYFGHFSVVELQSTFYELPSPTLAAKWHALTPDNVHICMKAWQLITHTPTSPTYRRLKSKLSDTEHNEIGWFRATEQVWLAWERTLAIAQILQAKVILFQCPKSFVPSKENIRNFRIFLSRLERGEHLLAWEPRGEWSAELVRELCGEFNLVHCVDPFTAEQVSGPGYWRLHGFGGYRYRYTDTDLRKLQDMRDRSAPLYILFNNVWMKEDALRFIGAASETEPASRSGPVLPAT